MGDKRRTSAQLAQERKTGLWYVEICLPDGKRISAKPGVHQQRIIYSEPERVPTHLKARIVPDLMRQAVDRNMRGER